MAWIEVLDEDEVLSREDRLARLYRAAMDERTGRVDNIIQVHGLRPETLEGHLRLYRAVMHAAEGLSRRERESMAIVVSAYNHCGY